MTGTPDYLRRIGLTSIPTVSGKSNNLIGIQGRDLDPRHFTLMVRNIESAYHHATAAQLQEGLAFYPRGQEIAHEIGRGNIKVGAGVIAALSPKTEWGLNVSRAQEFMKKGTVAGLSANVRKAQRIREGEDPEEVLPMHLKTGHFYKNLSDPDNPNYLSVDTHAHDVASAMKPGYASRRGLGEAGRYNTFVSAYNLASQRLGIEIPNRVQSVTWHVWRDLEH